MSLLPLPPSRHRTRHADVEHRWRDVECPLCHQVYTGRAFVCPDPEGRSQARANERARSWLATHPCIDNRSVAL